MSTVRYDLEAPTDEAVAELRKAAQAMQQLADEADDLSNSMELLSIPAKKVGAASKEAATGAKTAKDAFDGMAQAGAAMGGKVAGASGLLKGFVDGAVKAGSAGGALGVAAAGAAASIGVLSYAMYKGVEALLSFGRSAVEAREDLDGFVDQEVIENLDELARKFENLDLQAKVLKGTVASDLTPVIGGLVTELTGLLTIAEDVAVALGEIQPPDSAAWRAALAVATGGSSELARILQEIGAQTEEELAGSIAQVVGSWDKLKPPVEDHEDALTDVVDKYLELQREAEAAEKAAIAEIDRRMALGHQVTEMMDAELAKQKAVEQRRLDERWRAWKSELERELAEAARMFDALEQQYAEDTAAFEKELAKRKATMDMVFNAMIGGVSELVSTTFGLMFDNLREETDRALKGIEDKIEASNDKIEKWKEEDAEKNKDLIENEMAWIEKYEQDKRDIQAQAWKDEQQMKAGQAIMAGALAIVQAYAQLGPIGGTLMAPLIVGMTAMQVETITGQSPPSFHDGGSMGADEMMFGRNMVRNGEAAVVFNQRATESGAVERAMAANRDMDSPREMKLVMADSGRVVGELVAREMRRPGSPIGAFGSSSGNRDPYGNT